MYLKVSDFYQITIFNSLKKDKKKKKRTNKPCSPLIWFQLVPLTLQKKKNQTLKRLHSNEWYLGR